MPSEPGASSIAPSNCSPACGPAELEPAQPAPQRPPTTDHARVREHSYGLLEDARVREQKARRYDSNETRRIMVERCQERAHITPYPEQLDLAECMLLGLDATCIAGTGWGKTLSFVLPLFAPQSKGKVIIIASPLNALEVDQAERLQKMGLSAVALNGETSTPELLKEIEKGTYSVVIVGPKLLTEEGSAVRALLSRPHFSRKVLGFVIDEAHCICQWGGEFREEYSQLSIVRSLLPTRTSVLAVSATMTPAILDSTCRSIQINPERAFMLNLGNNRRNIKWEVRNMKAANSDLECLSFLIPDDLDSVTCLPKTMVFFDNILQSMKARRWLLEQLPERLHERVKCYNARQGDLTKKRVMRGFREGTIDVLFTTEAAGMGCDIPDIILVVQYMTPDSLGVWVQRAGRGGRRPDIQARAILLVQSSVFAEKGKKDRKDGDPVAYVKTLEPGLRKYVDAPTDSCRRDVVDEYFNNPRDREAAPPGHCCDNCTQREAAAERQEAERAVEAGALTETLDEPAISSAGRTAMVVSLPAGYFSPRNWRVFLQNVLRKDREIDRATKLLEHWRRRTWWQQYSTAPFPPRGILPDSAVKTLAARHTFAVMDDLAGMDWLLVEKHGPEVLAVLALVDMPLALAELQRRHTEHQAKEAAAAERERKRLDQERQKVERAAERERAKLKREVQAAERKLDAEIKRRERETKRAVESRRKWYRKAASIALKRTPPTPKQVSTSASQEGTRTCKRRQAEDPVEDSRSGKKARADKENIERTRAAPPNDCPAGPPKFGLKYARIWAFGTQSWTRFSGV